MKQLFSILVIAIINGVQAQDVHFSQLSVNSLVNNPASAGVYNGWERLSVNHKNQWVNANTNYLTTSIAADINLFKPRGDKGAYLGLGILFYNDIGGDSQFGLRHFNASISGIVPLNRNNRVSFGISPGFGQRSAKLDGLLFPNQFDGQALNPSLSSFEASTISSNLYGDFSFGFLYQYGDIKKTIVSNRKMSFTLGLAYSHFNQPEINFNGLYRDKLYGKLSIGGSLIKDFQNSKLGLETFSNFYSQGPYQEVFIAGLLRYQLAAGSKMTRLKKQAIMCFGMAYRHKDAVIPMIRFQKGDWQLGLSYDVTISTLGTFNRSGGLEFSLVFNSQRFALIARR